MLVNILMVGFGGFTGAILRYLLGELVQGVFVKWHFPFGTLAVNLLGCLAIGFLGGMFEGNEAIPHHIRLLIFTGLLGGFTTFSAFGLETFSMIDRGYAPQALIYIAASISIGIFLVWAGNVWGRAV